MTRTATPGNCRRTLRICQQTRPATRYIKPRCDPGKTGIFLDRRLSRRHGRLKLSAPIQLTRPLDGTRRLKGTTSSTTVSTPASAIPVPAPAIPTEARRAQCLTVYLWAKWVQKPSLTTTRYPLRYSSQLPSLPTCCRRHQKPDADPVPTHWVPHRCSQSCSHRMRGGE